MRGSLRKKTLALYEETVLRALEKTETALANYPQSASTTYKTERSRSREQTEGVVDFLELLDAESALSSKQRTRLPKASETFMSRSLLFIRHLAEYSVNGAIWTLCLRDRFPPKSAKQGAFRARPRFDSKRNRLGAITKYKS